MACGVSSALATSRPPHTSQTPATAGRWAGNKRPFGYQADGVTVDQVASIKEEVAKVRSHPLIPSSVAVGQ